MKKKLILLIILVVIGLSVVAYSAITYSLISTEVTELSFKIDLIEGRYRCAIIINGYALDAAGTPYYQTVQTSYSSLSALNKTKVIDLVRLAKQALNAKINETGNTIPPME